ncbi:MAG: type IX secretion system sortase PorU [Bacteroidota bacterium]|nr:type IX secretion system sortase PorU [Bacteroidota bacterium]
MKSIAKIFLAVCFLQAPSFAQPSMAYPDVKVLQTDAQGITIEFRPKYFSNEKISADGNTYEVPRFQFGLTSGNSTAGKEDIRVRVLQLALRGRTGNTVSIIGSDFENVTGFSLAPVPEINMVDNLGTVKKAYRTNFSAPQDFFPTAVASIENPSLVKGILVGNLIIAPYQFQSMTKTLRKYTRIVIRVDYGAQKTTFEKSDNDEWAQASVLNYSAAIQWMRVPVLKKSTAISSVLSTGTWFKMEVVQDGMYKIDANYLRSIGVDAASLSSIYDIKIFGADGRRIPEDLNITRPTDLPQMAVQYVDNNSNAKFDTDDYILFFGQGITGWNYNAAQKTYIHYTNPYTNSNYYFLSIAANVQIKKAENISVGGSSGGKITSTVGKMFFDEERINFNQSGMNWVSAPFNSGDSRVISNKLYGRVPGTTVLYKYYLYSRANAAATFTLEESGQPMASSVISGFSDDALNDPVNSFANSNGREQAALIPNLTDDRSNVKFTYSSAGTVANGYIDWLEIFYTYNLLPVNDQLQFDSPDTTGLIEFALSGYSNNDVNVFEVSNANGMRKLITQMGQLTGSLSFKDTMSYGVPKKYWVGTSSQYFYPKSFTKIPNTNLHGYNGSDFIIVTHSEFKSQAERLKIHKESLPKPITTIVVDVDSIYNEFGIGMPDPVSLRDFLKYATENWNIKPKYVLFFGDASYDYKSILGNDKSWVPTFESSESNDKINSYNYDDFLAYLDPLSTATVSIAHGRLCPRSEDDAKFLVDRIIQYESKQFFSPWKNIVTIVADDIYAAESTNETYHVEQAEVLATDYTPKDFEIKKIYIGEYPTVFASSGRRKPDARLAIIDQVNQGTLVLNFTGHGNPKVWAHESILTYDDVKTQFFNNAKLTFIVAATCDWGRFDEAGEQSSAEEVVVNRKGGAVGVFSATRAVYSDFNAETNQKFYSNLFGSNQSLPLGDVTMLTKNAIVSNDINKQKYFLLGDPTMRLANPAMKIGIDSINNLSVTISDTLRALEKVTIKAAVRDTSNILSSNYNGIALVTVFDADKHRIISESGQDYYTNGPVIYKGENSIKNGKMEASFIVPKDISYENKNGRMSIYFSNTSTDGRGFTTNFSVGGSNLQAKPDSSGPQISIYFDNTSFRSGDVVNDQPTLLVDLKDSSGINSSGSAIGHRIEAWLDESAKSIDLTDFYKGKTDSYQQGRVEYPMTNLSSGNHALKVRAWDVYNNSSSAEVNFTVAASDGLSIQQLYNFPNPVSSTTAFTFQQNQLTPIDVQIDLFTVSGRKIHTINRYAITDRFVKIAWDRRDRDGDVVGNGVYFYKVIAKTIDGKFTSEAIGKMAIVR